MHVGTANLAKVILVKIARELSRIQSWGQTEVSVGRSRDDQGSSKKDSEDTPFLETEKSDRCVRPKL